MIPATQKAINLDRLFLIELPRKIVPVDFTHGDLIDGNKKTNTRAMAGID